MSKRIKSGLITAVSMFGTALVAAIATPQWSSFVVYAHDKAVGWGVPAVVIALLGVIVSEIWKQILNKRTMKMWAGGSGLGSGPDLY